MKLKYTALLLPVLAATACMEEIDPQTSYVSQSQLNNAPNSASDLTSAITSDLVGHPVFAAYTKNYANDYGLSSFYLIRDVEGQDIVGIDINYNWYSSWEFSSVSLGPGYSNCQMPWSCYYSWIKNCNTVLSVTGTHPEGEMKTYAGIAHAMRAWFYMDIAQMYAPETYGKNPEAPTVPIVTESTTITQVMNNPRATNAKMWEFIIKDLDAAESELTGYKRPDKTTPDLSVVYGLKARAYLVMTDWANAEKYARLAQNGYTPLTGAQYNDRITGFNTPNDAWMQCMTYKADDRSITYNDGDASWGTWMITELTAACKLGYASNYGYPFHIDRHLYETIPASDIRKDTFIDFKVYEDLEAAYEANKADSGDDAATAKAKEDAIAAAERAAVEYVRIHNSDYPENMVFKYQVTYHQGCGGLPVKFRPAGGDAGYNNANIGYVVSVPMMRVEEMMLIEAEAAGMQSEPRGKELLTTFGLLRDPGYVYGTHSDTYNSTYATAFQNEVWWQRRVELWGEGLATFDIKRLDKGIIRSYANTNHQALKRWNTEKVPQWMTWCITGTEIDYNTAISGKNNPTPSAPTTDSPEHVF